MITQEENADVCLIVVICEYDMWHVDLNACSCVISLKS